MRGGFAAVIAALAVSSLAVVAPVIVVAQTSPGAAVAATPTAAKPAVPAKAAGPLKTPWGDPDISGVWTSDAARGIPMERPDNFQGRAELNDQEFAEKQQRDERTRKAAENAVGSFRNDGAWLDKSYRQTSRIIEPPDGKMPATTPEADKRRAPRDRGTFGNGPFDTIEDFTLYDRCITRGIIGSILPVVYGNGNRIIQAPGMVVISYEMVHDTRVIYTDGRPHVSPRIRQYLGDARGHWDGNTLVIETTNLTDQTSIGANGNGVRHSADMVLTERITRVAGDEIRYEVTINDPKTYAKPWTISLPLTSPPGFQLLPYECHEGDYAVKNALSAERAEDKALDEDLKKGIVRARRGVQGNINAVPGTPGAE
jgi:hypothetical protein